MRKLAIAVATCRLFDPGACPDRKPDITCAQAQEAVAGGYVEYVGYWHCGTGIQLHDGGFRYAPDRCDFHARCDGGRCPDVGMAIE